MSMTAPTSAGIRQAERQPPSYRNRKRQERVPEAEPTQPRSFDKVTLVLAMVALVGVAAAGTFALLWNQGRATAVEQLRVETSARHFLHALTTFTPSTVDAEFAQVKSYATGDFANQAQHFFNTSIRQQLQTAKASATGQVRDLYVEKLKADGASLFAVVDQTYTNDKIGSTAADVLRLAIDMKLTASGWKVSDLTVLQAPTPSNTQAGPSASTPSATAGSGSSSGGSSAGSGGG